MIRSKRRLRFYIFCLVLLVAACSREYSHEGGYNPSIPPVVPPPSTDTTTQNKPEFQVFPDTAWRFEMSGVIHYGFLSTASYGRIITDSTLDTTLWVVGLTPDRITQFSIHVKIDSFNIIVGKMYDANSIVFSVWDPPNGLTFLSEAAYFYQHYDVNFFTEITSYDAGTRMIEGIFYGGAFDEQSHRRKIRNGRFKAKMHF